MEEMPEQWKKFITLFFFVRQIVKLSEFITLSY